MDKLKELRQRVYHDIPKEAKAIREAAEAEDRTLTQDETARVEALRQEKQTAIEEIERLEALADLEVAPAAGRIEVGLPAAAARPFASLGEQLHAIAEASSPHGVVDPRLYAAASGASSGSGAGGGFFLQSEFSTALMSRAFGEGVAQFCDPHELGPDSDSLEVAYNAEASRAHGSRWGGVRAYRIAEAGTVTDTAPKMERWECRIEDIMALGYATERLIRDATALEGWFSDAFTEEVAFVLDDEIINGSGVGRCLGILQSGALISVAKGGSQGADTVTAQNITDMMAALHPRHRANARWLINFEVEGQLPQMTIGNQPVYLPPGGLTNPLYGVLLGRPVHVIEQCNELGEVGDIILADMTQYKLIRKGVVAAAQSIHVRFLYNERAFRWVVSVNGAPKWKTALTPYKGRTGKKLSPFVTLAQRT